MFWNSTSSLSFYLCVTLSVSVVGQSAGTLRSTDTRRSTPQAPPPPRRPLPSFRLSACTRSLRSGNGQHYILCSSLIADCLDSVRAALRTNASRMEICKQPPNRRRPVRFNEDTRGERTHHKKKQQLRNEDIIAVIFLWTNGGPSHQI